MTVKGHGHSVAKDAPKVEAQRFTALVRAERAARQVKSNQSMGCKLIPLTRHYTLSGAHTHCTNILPTRYYTLSGAHTHCTHIPLTRYYTLSVAHTHCTHIPLTRYYTLSGAHTHCTHIPPTLLAAWRAGTTAFNIQ